MRIQYMRNQSENWPTELGTLKFLTRTERFGEVFGGFGLPPPPFTASRESKFPTLLHPTTTTSKNDGDLYFK